MNESFQELTDSQWQIIEKIIDDQRQPLRRTVWHPLRTMVNAILSINRTGTQWRQLDSKYPPWQRQLPLPSSFRTKHFVLF